MKPLILIAFSLAAITAHAADNDNDKFEITLVKDSRAVRTQSITTTPGIEGSYTLMTSTPAVTEVNTLLGSVENVATERKSGFTSKVRYQPYSDNGIQFVTAIVDYAWLDNGVTISKGHHVMKVKVGETVTLPGANGVELKVLVKS